jgi:hypothetical protein
VLQQLAEGVQQLQKEDPIARMLYCNGDCALRLATAKQMAALAARVQQLGDHQLMWVTWAALLQLLLCLSWPLVLESHITRCLQSLISWHSVQCDRAHAAQ